jgi:hypothetical protein
LSGLILQWSTDGLTIDRQEEAPHDNGEHLLFPISAKR